MMLVLSAGGATFETQERRRPEKIAVDLKPGPMEAMMARTSRRSVPQIFIDTVHVGGYDDLAALDRAGQLDTLLQTTGANAP